MLAAEPVPNGPQYFWTIARVTVRVVSAVPQA